MNILITGNTGYIGPVVVAHLKRHYPDSRIIGFDSGFFAHCLTGASRLPEFCIDKQIFGDMRQFPDEILQGIDTVIHLAAISNDPMGVQFESVTTDVNQVSTLALAGKAAAHGVKRFIFASSCSMYGFAEGGAKKETDSLNPLTAYARSKAAVERDLAAMATSGMLCTALRFSTACGFSPRLRLDLVLNDFVACAIADRKITVLSDGTPWRPLIEVSDMARAIEWAMVHQPRSGEHFLAVNVGSDEWNYQVRDLAEAVVRMIPGTTLSINTDAPPDKRSYKVDFSLYKELAPHHQPQVDLQQAIHGLKIGLESMGFADSSFRTSQFMRLKVLERHIAEKRLSANLDWI